MDKETRFIESLIDKTKDGKILWYKSYGKKVYGDVSTPGFYYTDNKTVENDRYIIKYYNNINNIYINDEQVSTNDVSDNYWYILKKSVENQVRERRNEEVRQKQLEWDTRQDKLLDIGLSW